MRSLNYIQNGNYTTKAITNVIMLFTCDCDCTSELTGRDTEHPGGLEWSNRRPVALPGSNENWIETRTLVANWSTDQCCQDCQDCIQDLQDLYLYCIETNPNQEQQRETNCGIEDYGLQTTSGRGSPLCWNYTVCKTCEYFESLTFVVFVQFGMCTTEHYKQISLSVP